MKKLTTLALMLVTLLLTLNPCFAASQPDYYATAKEHEAIGNFGSAADDYRKAAYSAKDLKGQAERYVDVVRCFLKSNNFRGAGSEMLNVRKNDPKNTVQLLAKYEPLARKALIESVSVNRSFNYPYEGMRNQEISYFKEFFPSGIEALANDFVKHGDVESATYWYDLATQVSDKASSKISGKLLGDVSKLTLQQKAQRLASSGKYITDQKKRQAYADELLPEGKRLAKIPGEEKRTDEIRNALVVLMGQSWVQENLPEEVIYYPGEYRINLEPGEQMAHWIRTPQDRDYEIGIFGNKGCDFVKPSKSGRIYQKNEGITEYHAVWKFRAINKISMRIVVK